MKGDLASEDERKGTVQRVLDVIGVLAEATEPISVGEAAQKLNLAPSTAHRFLNLLCREGFAVHLAASRRYTGGPELFRVAARINRKSSPVRVAGETIAAIAHEFNQTVLFGLYLPERKAMCFSARAEGSNQLVYRIEMDKPLSLVRGASGKVILAFLEPEQREAVLRAEAAALPAGAGTAAEGDLAATLGEIRRKHFWISEGEKLPGACGIAAPVFNTDGVVGCLCLTAPRETLPASGLDDIGRAIARHARSLSKNLGADPFP